MVEPSGELAYRGDQNLSRTYALCRQAGLTYDVAQMIDYCACGQVPVVEYLIERGFQSADAVRSHMEILGCWHDGSSAATAHALIEYLSVPYDE